MSNTSIKPEDLRLSNYVQFAPKGSRRHTIKPRNCKVLEIHDNHVRVLDFGMPLSIPYDSDELLPIPLTEEVLVEWCGFEKGCLVYKITDEWFIYWKDEMMWLQVEVANKNGYVCERFWLEQIKYLHDLQNWWKLTTTNDLQVAMT